jgi:hypothetical protein
VCESGIETEKPGIVRDCVLEKVSKKVISFLEYFFSFFIRRTFHQKFSRKGPPKSNFTLGRQNPKAGPESSQAEMCRLVLVM